MYGYTSTYVFSNCVLGPSQHQAGGAPTQNTLSAAMSSIQESLKNSDWSTRKAASMALGEIASSGGSLLGSCKASCIRSLESCRFDKVCDFVSIQEVLLEYVHLLKIVEQNLLT